MAHMCTLTLSRNIKGICHNTRKTRVRSQACPRGGTMLAKSTCHIGREVHPRFSVTACHS